MKKYKAIVYSNHKNQYCEKYFSTEEEAKNWCDKTASQWLDNKPSKVIDNDGIQEPFYYVDVVVSLVCKSHCYGNLIWTREKVIYRHQYL